MVIVKKSARILFYIILILAVLFIDSFTVSIKGRILSDTIISLIATLFFVTRKDNSKEVQSLGFRPVHLFIISYLIVFFQRPVDYLVGFVTATSYQIGSISVMPLCVKYASLGLLVFYIGYSILAYPKKQVRSTKKEIASPSALCVIAFLFIVAIVVTTPREVLLGGYGQEFIDSMGSFGYLYSWARIFIVAYYIQLCINDRERGEFVGLTLFQFIKKHSPLQLFNLLAYSLIIVNLGDRGPLIIIVTSFFLAYLILCRRRINMVFLIVFMIAGMLAISFLGLTKNYRNNNSIIDRVQAARQDNVALQSNSISPWTEELAFSYKCLAYSVNEIPEKMDYTHGLLQLSYVLSAVPFSSAALNGVVEMPENSAYLITHMIQGDFYTSGDGSSCLADLYIDGGLLFIILGMLLFGMLMRYFEFGLLTNNGFSLFMICLAFYFLIYMVYIPRSTLLTPFKYGVWLYIIMFLYHRFYRWLTRRVI